MAIARPMPNLRTRLWRSALVLIVTGMSARAYALDPSKTLSQYVRRIWQVQQGLPQASIEALLQTRDGYLWLGTQTGLVKFDGVRFTTIETVEGLSLKDIRITRLFEAHDGALWIGTSQNGLIRIQDGKARRYTRENGLPSDSVQCLVGDPADNIWACTSRGLVELSGDTIRMFDEGDGLSASTVGAACSTRNGTIFVGDDAGRVFSWTGDRFSAAVPAAGDAPATQAMLCARDGTLWIGSSSGLIHRAGAHEIRLTVVDGLADNSVLSLAEGSTGDIFAGTKNGFSRIRGGDVESFLPQDGLSQSTVFALYEDREGSLWVATKHGLNQFLDGVTTSYTTSEGLPSNQAGPVLEDSRGTVWAGTLGGGLGRFDGHRFATLTTADGLASDTIYALAEGRDGDLWAGTGAGLNRLVDGRVTDTWTTNQGMPGNVVRALYRDRDGALWIATSGGLAVFRGGRIRAVRNEGRRGHESILAIGGDREGHLYLAPQSDSSLLRDADAVHEDADGLLWVGTLGQGLRLVDEGHVFSFSEADGLFDDVIYGITEDDDGRLWMACSKGIFSVKRDDLKQFAAGRKQRIVSTPYSPLDAQRTIECRPGVQPVVARTGDGRLWFATIRGLLVIDPSHLSRSFLPPSAIVEDTTVNGERLAAAALDRLPSDRNNVEFSFTGVSFVVPNRITFKYLLEGFDKTWVDAGTRRQTFYTNLPPGHYRFRVSACNPDHTCGEAAAGTTFEIEPRYYQRAWFLPVCGAGLVLLFWTGYRLRIRQLRAKFDLILAERGRIARELHDTLIQGFAGITMSMQALASRLPASGTRETLEEIVADAGQSLREARQSLSGLRRRPDESGGLAPSVARIARHLTEPHDVRLNLTLGDQRAELPADVEYNLLRIAQEAMQNAVRHSGARTLDVTLESTRERLRLSVNDDGSGFDQTGSPPAGHYGLIGMRERAAQIGAIFELTSERGRGTTVSIQLES
ncbi:MAG TPA: two-component regulator propeller domain-containing protein [Vicinamibacterales bacterium]|nr:two-component regulator propeller domain-containing protein [Vicinamibacterales bacterium]